MKPRQKVFLTRDRIQLVSDERDFVVPVAQRREVLRWSRQAKVDVERPLNKDNQNLCAHYFGVDLWRVKDEQQRSWFALKWK